MISARILFLLACLAVLDACSGGGGGSGSGPPGPAWEKFRRDFGNTGQGDGSQGENYAPVARAVAVDTSRILASAAIGADESVYVGSEGGTFATLRKNAVAAELVSSCPVCSAGRGSALGSLVSSPAVYTLDSTTTIYLGGAPSAPPAAVAATGAVFGFQDSGSGAPTCMFCFEPSTADFGSDVETVVPSFLSSPTFTTNSVTGNVEAVLLGVKAQVRQRGGTTREVGKVYCLNGDGTVKWQFPPSGSVLAAPVTSSPAIGGGGALYFTTDDGILYALTGAGYLKWTVAAGPVTSPLSPIATSPVVLGSAVYVSTSDGTIRAFGARGQPLWKHATEGQNYSGSLAVGGVESPTETPTPAESPTPVTPLPGEPSPTPTRTPVPGATPPVIFGVTTQGRLTLLDAAQGTPLQPSSPLAVDGTVSGSPALASDGFVVIATVQGKLYSVNTASGDPPPTPTGTPEPTPTGTPPGSWPLQLTDPVTGAPVAVHSSSPVIAADGTIYVGADNGFLYAVGTGT